MSWIEQSIYNAIILAVMLSLSFSNARVENLDDRLHILAVDSSFDFFGWTVDAIGIKLGQNAMGMPNYISTNNQHEAVVEYIKLIHSIEDTQNQINLIYADPNVTDPAKASTDLRGQLAKYTARYNLLAPFAEGVLEQQVTQVLSENDLTVGGQPIPWVSFHITPLPLDLIISPRNNIVQETSYQLRADLTIEQQNSLETVTSQKLNVSSLVVPIGGLASYPTMIMRTTALDWLSSTIGHEWIHLYLGQRPLGNSYGTSGELRTMNETTASIVGDEIGRIVLQRYYPELLTETPPTLALASYLKNKTAPDALHFDYDSEMHLTRITADTLLAEGKIDEAEAYMEARRKVFWDNGRPIRKLNQAFFAFYGAYANVPGGPAGEDPVGPAVRALRQQSRSFTAFLQRIAQMSSFAELQEAVKNGGTK